MNKSLALSKYVTVYNSNVKWANVLNAFTGMRVRDHVQRTA